MTVAQRIPHAYPPVRKPARRPRDVQVPRHPDIGCGLASRRLRRPVRCLECPFPTCLEDAPPRTGTRL